MQLFVQHLVNVFARFRENFAHQLSFHLIWVSHKPKWTIGNMCYHNFHLLTQKINSQNE